MIKRSNLRESLIFSCQSGTSVVEGGVLEKRVVLTIKQLGFLSSGWAFHSLGEMVTAPHPSRT